MKTFINLPFWTFWKGPIFSNSFKLIGAFPPFEGGNDENWGGNDGSNANPCRSLKVDSSDDEGMGLNWGGSGSDAANCCSAGCVWRLFNCEDARDFPALWALLTGRRRITLPDLSAPAIEDTRRIPNVIA